MKIALIAGGVAIALLAAAATAWVTAAWFVERPEYEVVRAEGRIEIRDYPALRLAEVEKPGAREAAIRAGFRPLARYIFARDREGESISMTAPVTQTREGGSWRVAFIMPSDYALDALPEPAQEGVRLRESAPERVAAIRFSGRADDAMLAEREAALRDWLRGEGLPADGPATYAFYNDPFTPGFLRRNEVLIPLDPSAESAALR